MENPKVSVIIPAYNAEKYVAKCIESVLTQTYHNIELIIINDGSKDNTLSIIKDYEKKYSSITVIDKPNTGVSDTRNVGIKASRGDFIIFLDSDDTLQADYIERHVDALSEDVDLVISKLFGIDDNNPYCIIDTYDKLYHERMLPWAFPFCKLFKAKIISTHSIMFDTRMKLCEDWMFVMDYIKYVSKISVINYMGYNWNNDNSNSLSRGCSFEYRLHAYDVAVNHLTDVHKSIGVEDNTLYMTILKNNNIMAIQRLYQRGAGEEITVGRVRRARLSEFYELYGTPFDRMLLKVGILPLIIDVKLRFINLMRDIKHNIKFK